MSFYTKEIADLVTLGKKQPVAKVDPYEANEWF